MKSSCIQHPANEPLIIVRQWQINFCEGNKCAALLMSYFEYWHNVKLEMSKRNQWANDIAEREGDTRTQDESVIQFHSQKTLSEGILKLYSESAIGQAIQLLKIKGVISVQSNPNPRYKFDKTSYFVFYPEVCQAWIDNDYNNTPDLPPESGTFHRDVKTPSRCRDFTVSTLENKASCLEITPRCRENTVAITKTTSLDHKLETNLISADAENAERMPVVEEAGSLLLDTSEPNESIPFQLKDSNRMAKPNDPLAAIGKALNKHGLPIPVSQNERDQGHIEEMLAQGASLEQMLEVLQTTLTYKAGTKFGIAYLKTAVFTSLTRTKEKAASAPDKPVSDRRFTKSAPMHSIQHLKEGTQLNHEIQRVPIDLNVLEASMKSQFVVPPEFRGLSRADCVAYLKSKGLMGGRRGDVLQRV